jgi:putative transposase
MQRGIEGSRVFADDVDRWVYLDRAQQCFAGDAPRCLSWALMTNHDHLTTVTRSEALSKSMHSLGTSYASYFNKRHDRQGHLYQNRYKSLLVQEEDYLYRVIRYVMLNPIRAGILRDLQDLQSYPFTSYAGLMGNIQPRVVDAAFTLQLFHNEQDQARGLLKDWMVLGLEQDDPIGEILERGTGRPAKEEILKQVVSRIAIRDSYVVGNRPFVARVLTDANHPAADRLLDSPLTCSVEDLIEAVCGELGVPRENIASRMKHKPISDARAAIAWLGVDSLGMTQTELARHLGVTQQALSFSLQRGRRLADTLILDLVPDRQP